MYRVMAKRRPARLSQMRLGQKVKVHASIALPMEKVEFDALFEQNSAWPN